MTRDTRPAWQREGQEPDYRFSLANERTFLAWIRTALALLAAGLVLDQWAVAGHPHAMVKVVAAALCIASMLLAVLAYLRWKGNEIAMRHARPLPGNRGTTVLTAIAIVLALMVAYVIFGP